MQKTYSIAIDGPSGAGKSTVARMLARQTGCLYLDTGAMYRAVGLWMLEHAIPVRDYDAVEGHIDQVEIDIRYENEEQRVYLNGRDVSLAIRAPIVSDAASAVSASPLVRERMVAQQQAIARGRSVVMDGRDIATKVLPDATVKIYLVADVNERARRRYLELQARGVRQTYESVLEEMRKRDYDDSHRQASPLTRADDAVVIDASALSPEAVVARILLLLEERRRSP